MFNRLIDGWWDHGANRSPGISHLLSTATVSERLSDGVEGHGRKPYYRWKTGGEDRAVNQEGSQIETQPYSPVGTAERLRGGLKFS